MAMEHRPIVKKPNVVIVFADQWRQQATGFAGDPNVQTPTLDALAGESLHFTHALSGCPVCSPYRASLLTGQRALTHGVFVNDVCLQPRGTTLAEAFAQDGYDTAYIGKWHLDGHGRSAPIPRQRRHGFDYWKVLECTHDYNHSAYHAGDATEPSIWNGYDAWAQTQDAVAYLRDHSGNRPFLLVLSWGPPHEPYATAPREVAERYDPDRLVLRANVPPDLAPQARQWLAGYYAHCTALDACLACLLKALAAHDLDQDTILLFTSDHGDMLGSQGQTKKQRPWDESIRVPFLLRWPALNGRRPRTTDALIDACDIMPTLLGLCGLPVPGSVQGRDLADHIAGGPAPADDAALILCPQPFGQWNAVQHGGREYRGLRTRRWTYVRDRQGPWLLYDNDRDPCQLYNLVDDANAREAREALDHRLKRTLADQNDDFLPGMDYIRSWGYTVDATGTVPYTR